MTNSKQQIVQEWSALPNCKSHECIMSANHRSITCPMTKYRHLRYSVQLLDIVESWSTCIRTFVFGEALKSTSVSYLTNTIIWFFHIHILQGCVTATALIAWSPRCHSITMKGDTKLCQPEQIGTACTNVGVYYQHGYWYFAIMPYRSSKHPTQAPF